MHVRERGGFVPLTSAHQPQTGICYFIYNKSGRRRPDQYLEPASTTDLGGGLAYQTLRGHLVCGCLWWMQPCGGLGSIYITP